MPEDAGLRHIVQRYFDALYEGDVALFRDIFHPAAMLYCFTDPVPVIMNLDQYCALVHGRPSARSRGDRREDEIVLLHSDTPTTAHARVRDLYLPKHFTDELTLAKTPEGWKIVAKVWHYTTQ